jgi:hypothetical protein
MIPQLLYSVDELACLLAGFENEKNERLLDIVPFDETKNIPLAMKCRSIITQHLGEQYLKLPSEYTIVESDINGNEWTRLDNVISRLKNDFDSKWHYQGTEQIVPAKNILKWAREYNLNINIAEPSMPTKPATEDIAHDLPRWSDDIQTLLDGNHEKQAPELAEAIKIWLEAIHDPKLNTASMINSLKSRVLMGDPTASDDKQRRIAKVVNWKK